MTPGEPTADAGTHVDETLVAHARGGNSAARRTSRLCNRDTAVAVAGLVVGGTVLFFARDIPLGPEGPTLGPRWWPRVLAGFMLLTAVILAANGIRKPLGTEEDTESITRTGSRRFLGVIALLPLYALAWLNLDFRVCTPLFLAALCAALGSRRWRTLIAFPVILTALMYLVFAVGLGVAL